MRCSCKMIFKSVERKKRDGQATGACSHPDYKIWAGITQRCNPRSRSKAWNKVYIGKVKMSKEWADSFDNFTRDMGNRPGRGYSVDRKDNSKGYCRHNCRWATAYEQILNRRNFKFSGVSPGVRKKGKKYVARITLLGKMFQLGTYETAQEAEADFDRYRKYIDGIRDSESPDTELL